MTNKTASANYSSVNNKWWAYYLQSDLLVPLSEYLWAVQPPR